MWYEDLVVGQGRRRNGHVLGKLQTWHVLAVQLPQARSTSLPRRAAPLLELLFLSCCFSVVVVPPLVSPYRVHCAFAVVVFAAGRLESWCGTPDSNQGPERSPVVTRLCERCTASQTCNCRSLGRRLCCAPDRALRPRLSCSFLLCGPDHRAESTSTAQRRGTAPLNSFPRPASAGSHDPPRTHSNIYTHAHAHAQQTHWRLLGSILEPAATRSPRRSRPPWPSSPKSVRLSLW